MANDEGRAMMSHNMINRGPGKRQIKPTAFLLSQIDLPDDDEEDDIEFGAANRKVIKDSDNSDSDDDDEGDSEVSSSDDSDASSSVETDETAVNDDVVDIGPICSVCLNLHDSARNDTVIHCDKCGVAVHENCYGGVFLEADNGSNVESWFCEPCALGVNSPHCELCPETKGAFKLTEFAGQYIHMVCALFTENITWADNVNLLGASYQEVKHRHFGRKRCSGCSEEVTGRSGVASRCELGECNKYYHITCAQRLGLLVDRSDADDGPETHPRFVCCKAHYKNTDAVKAMKEMHFRFQKQEVERQNRPKEGTVQVEKDRLAMKAKLDDIFAKMMDTSITKPDLRCGALIRQRYARHIHTSARLLDDFQRKAEFARNAKIENGVEAEETFEMTAEEMEEQMNILSQKNKKLLSLKKKIEAEKAKVMQLHAKKEARLAENKRNRLKQLQEELPTLRKEAPKAASAAAHSEQMERALIDVLTSYDFPERVFEFGDESEEDEEESEEESESEGHEKENPKPVQNKSKSGTPSPKRRKISRKDADSGEEEMEQFVIAES